MSILIDFMCGNIKERGDDSKPWDILVIRNGLKCVHQSKDENGKPFFEEYFESDELNGERAFEHLKAMTPIQVFTRLMLITPLTKGFVYNNWSIINNDKKGFIIKPRLTPENQGIEKYNGDVFYERYKTNESLNRINISSFIRYVEEDVEDYD